MENTRSTRRHFLAGLAAAGALAGCTQPEPNGSELVQRLNGAQFIEGSDTSKTPKTINQIKRLNTGKYTVVAFGFGLCGGLCPIIFPQLGNLEEKGFQIAVINTVPEAEGAFLPTDQLAGMLKMTGSKNAVTLYPLDSKKQFSDYAAAMASANLGAQTAMDDGVQHSGKVFLFDPSGKEIATALINDGKGPIDPDITDQATIVERFTAAKQKSEAARAAQAQR